MIKYQKQRFFVDDDKQKNDRKKLNSANDGAPAETGFRQPEVRRRIDRFFIFQAPKSCIGLTPLEKKIKDSKVWSPKKRPKIGQKRSKNFRDNFIF